MSATATQCSRVQPVKGDFRRSSGRLTTSRGDGLATAWVSRSDGPTRSSAELRTLASVPDRARRTRECSVGASGSRRMSRVAAIALDAADVHMIQRLIDRGELPFLRALRARSACYQLRSDTLYRGTLIWEAFLAGHQDVGHGAGGGFVFEPDSYASFEVGALGTVPFYERAPGITPIAIDVPHLAPSGSGVRVCCWGGHTLNSVRGSV